MSGAVKVALVTGAASGMGRRWAERMAASGVRVAAVDRDGAQLASAWHGVAGVSTHVCDVIELADVKAVVAAAVAAHGPLDRVVHAAGIMPGSPLVTDDPERTKRVMRVNYDGTVNLVHATVPAMLERKAGEFIGFGSVAGEALTPRLGAYCASKAAVNAYLEVLAHELRDSGVLIHLVCPPMVDTPLLAQSMDTAGPRSLKKAMDEKMLATPDQVIDGVEKSVARRAPVSHPLAASKALHVMRRVAPSLLWKIIDKAEDEMARKA